MQFYQNNFHYFYCSFTCAPHSLWHEADTLKKHDTINKTGLTKNINIVRPLELPKALTRPQKELAI